MQTIGVLGGFGPQATMDFETMILEEARLVRPPQQNRSYPPMVTVHVRHAPIELGDDGRAREPLVLDPRVLDVARRLGEWADFLVIVANTPHLFVDEISRAAGRDVVSMVDLTIEELRRREASPVGLLGLGVPQAHAERMAREGLEVRLAPEDLRDRLDAAIFRLMEGRATDADRVAAREATDALRDAGAPVIVLGCTEIPLLLGRATDADDLIDPTRLLARAAVRRAMG